MNNWLFLPLSCHKWQVMGPKEAFHSYLAPGMSWQKFHENRMLGSAKTNFLEKGSEHDFRLNFGLELRKLKRKSKRVQKFWQIFAQIEASVFISTSICIRKREQEQKQDDEVRALMTPGAIVAMHRDATWEDEPVLQLMAKKVVEGKLVSVTMSDGSHVSANIEPSEESMAKALKAVQQYDLVKIRSASVQRSKMILH